MVTSETIVAAQEIAQQPPSFYPSYFHHTVTDVFGVTQDSMSKENVDDCTEIYKYLVNDCLQFSPPISSSSSMSAMGTGLVCRAHACMHTTKKR